jgi:hypothetical protein
VFTRDGDLVNIEIGIARSAFMGGMETAGGSMFNMLMGTMGSGLNFSVEGDLDDDELVAIAELLENVNELANAFFDSDLQAAFGMAMELGFDQDELSGFALDLNRRKTSFVAFQEQGDAVQPVFDTINGVAHMAQNVMSHAVLDLFEQPTSFVTNLFDTLTLGTMFDSEGTTENIGREWVQDLLAQLAADRNGETRETADPENRPGTDEAPGIDQYL